jgi:hypothetical protein
MAVNTLQIVEIIEVMENFLDRIRPPENIRTMLDITYRIEQQSVVIYERRTVLNRQEKTTENEVAKATFIEASNCWKIYWLRPDKRWYSYEPRPRVNSLKAFVELVEEDVHGCFWG